MLDERRGNMRFFRLNTKHSLYEEIRSIISKTIGLENELRELEKCYEVAENMMKRRGISLSEDDKFILKYLHHELA